MIRPNTTTDTDTPAVSEEVPRPACIVLARYGQVPQVARFGISADVLRTFSGSPGRGQRIVVESDRGPEVATVLDEIRQGLEAEEVAVTGSVLRPASVDDLTTEAGHRRQCELDYSDWLQRIDKWKLQLQLIDLERTLDPEQVILYVLNGQDAETTRLALLAAAAGLGIVHVQPVSSQGIVHQNSGGCGSGGCGSGGCST